MRMLFLAGITLNIASAIFTVLSLFDKSYVAGATVAMLFSLQFYILDSTEETRRKLNAGK